MEKSFKEPLVTLKHGNTPEVKDEVMKQKGQGRLEEDGLMDFGELEDYAEIYGDMDDL